MLSVQEVIYVAVFAVLTILLLAFTLARPHRHRFYRFFAWDSALLLVLMNAKAWFHDPLSPRQLVSWALLAGSLAMAVEGFRLLRSVGAPKDDIEDTTKLVTVGAYRYIRHPLYASLLLFGLGAFLKAPALPSLLVLIVLSAFVYATAKVEEGDNIAGFGEEYVEYMKRTKMFIPYLF